jgi:membrane-bound serine protease (ClpP class)
VRATTTLASALLLTVLAAFALGRYLPQTTRFRRLVLADGLAGYTAAETDDSLVGQRGRALSPLRPAGTASFDGRRVDVTSDGRYVAPGATVEVVRVRGARVEVRPVDA